MAKNKMIEERCDTLRRAVTERYMFYTPVLRIAEEGTSLPAFDGQVNQSAHIDEEERTRCGRHFGGGGKGLFPKQH